MFYLPDVIEEFLLPTAFILVYFLFCITIPPDVVIILHQGAFYLLSVFTGSVQKAEPER